MAGNWERRPEEGGGWETLYDKDGLHIITVIRRTNV